MSLKSLTDRIKEAMEKTENRGRNIAAVLGEIYPGCSEEFIKDMIDAMLAESIYSNDPIAQQRKRELEEKYKNH